MRGFLGAGAGEKQIGFRSGRAVGGEHVESILRAADRVGGGSVRFKNLFLERNAGVILQDLREVLSGGSVLAQRAFSLCGPEERVFVEQRVGFRLLEPVEGLLRAGFRIVVVAESKSGALSPNAGTIFVREGS